MLTTVSECGWLAFLYLIFTLGVSLRYTADVYAKHTPSLERSIVVAALIMIALRYVL
jgi:hypothetical protein